MPKRPAIPKPRPEPLAYSMQDASHVSGLSQSRLYELAREGAIRLSRIAGRTLVPRAELQKLIEAGTQSPEAIRQTPRRHNRC